MALIYHAFDVRNGRCYVGQTWDQLSQRMRVHLTTKRKFLFQNVLQESPGSFVWSVLCDNLVTQKDLDAAEVYWGTHLHALAPERYSLKLGQGKGKASDVTKEKLRLSAMRANARPEVRAKKRNAALIANADPEVRRRKSEGQLRYNSLPDTKAKRSAVQSIVQKRPQVIEKRAATIARKREMKH